jgi:peptide-methionine (R)-S-oxide reductase
MTGASGKKGTPLKGAGNKDSAAKNARDKGENEKDSGDKAGESSEDSKEPPKKVVKTDAEWRKQLSAMQYKVTRKKATEVAGTGRYAHSKKDGIYRCVCCGQPLFDSTTKYESGTGWPSFSDTLEGDIVNYIEDTSNGEVRVEVECSRCDAHLGHVFSDGPPPTGRRYCMNSAALDLVSREADKDARAREARNKAARAKSAEKSKNATAEKESKEKDGGEKEKKGDKET